MAREHARIWLDINSDDDFESLPFDAQGFYTRVVLTLDDLSYCGVATWRPRKLTTKAPDLTYERILCAASALEVGRYCLFDLDTEEVMARSYIRRDQLLRNPKYAAAVVRTYNGIASKSLRAAVVTEVRRVRDEHPEYSSWTARDKTTDIGAELSKLMAKPGLDEMPYADRIVVPVTNGHSVSISNADSVSIGNTQSVPITNVVGNADSVSIPLTLTHTLTPSPLEGYVSREPPQGDEPDPNPRPLDRCPRHRAIENPPACRACQAARESAEAWDADRDAEVIAQRTLLAAAVEACRSCDPKGWLLGDDGLPLDRQVRCPRHDWSLIDA